jgi:hypothetical protein
MGQDTYLSDKNDERINPAIEELQRELLEELRKSGRRSTDDVVYQTLTIGTANEAHPLEKAHGCNAVLFWTAAQTVKVGDASGQPVLLVQNIWNLVPINNTSLLRFLGTSGGEVIYVISSN